MVGSRFLDDGHGGLSRRIKDAFSMPSNKDEHRRNSRVAILFISIRFVDGFRRPGSISRDSDSSRQDDCLISHYRINNSS